MVDGIRTTLVPLASSGDNITEILAHRLVGGVRELVRAAPNQITAYYTAAMFGSGSAAARAAFDDDVPVWLDSGVSYLDVQPTAEAAAATAVARHTWFKNLIKWRARCVIGTNAELRIRITQDGLHTLAAWDVDADSYQTIKWGSGSGGVLYIEAEDEAVEYVIATIAIGTRGASTYSPHVVFRGINDYELTIALTTALEGHVVVGYAVGLKNTQGTNDAECLTGAMIIESISGDRLTITGTVTLPRAESMAGSTVVDSASAAYQEQLPSRLVVPSACLGIDTDYTVSASKAITGVTSFSSKVITGITRALTGVATAVAHGFTNGQLITISGVVGMTEVNNQSFIVTGAAADTFQLYDSDGPVNTSTYDAYTSGGVAVRPLRLTVASHGYTSGALVRLAAISGMTQLNGRQVRVGTPDTNDFAVLDLSGVGVDSTGYGAYVSGGTTSEVVEKWTGSAVEAYFNFVNGGKGIFEKLGVAWHGWTGLYMDQDLVIVENAGSYFKSDLNCVFSGAGDKVFRGYGAGAQLYIANTCAGGGRAQEVVAPQGGCDAQIVRCNIGGVHKYAAVAGDNSEITITGSIFAGCLNTLFIAELGRMSVLASRVSGGVRGIYPVGGDVQCYSSAADNASATRINLCDMGLDGIGSSTVSGYVVFGTGDKGNTTNSRLVANSVGSTTSGRGGAKWTQGIASEQSLGGLFVPLNPSSTNVSAVDTTATVETPAGVLTTTTLTLAAGASKTITVTSALAATTSLIFVDKQGGSNTDGTPDVRVSARNAGNFDITIKNMHPSILMNGTLVIAFFLMNPI